MLPSTTQQILPYEDGPLQEITFLRSISVLDRNDFKKFIQEKYGAHWGVLKFEDSLSDYSNDVSNFLIFNNIKLDFYLIV